MHPPISFDRIPITALALEFLEVGQFDNSQRGHVHSKTCPYTILAQAVQGRYEIATDDGRGATMKEGDAFLTRADLPLRIVHHGDAKRGYRMRVRWIHMHITLYGSIDVTGLLDLPLRVTRTQCEPFGEIIEELLAAEAQPYRTLQWTARRSACAFRTLELLSALAPPRRDAFELLHHNERLGPALTFMDQHLDEKLTVDDLARRAHMSTPHFHAVFRQFMGRSPMKHLRYLRLAKACQLLATGEATLQVVAEETGFCNEFHLSREFRRAFGKPPGAWRRDFDGRLV